MRVIACALVLLASITSTVRADDTELGARAHVQAPNSAEERVAGRREITTLRATQGDSFSIAESMPAALPVFSGVPYLIIRGAPPAGTIEIYDGAPVPVFSHLALGPWIAHPSLVSGVRFHAAVAPARYGRRLGAVIVYDAPDLAPPDYGELELRAIDAQALVHTQGITWAAAHARFGFPGLWLSAVGADVALEYGDYQLRMFTPLGSSSSGARTTAVVHAFGAFDALGTLSEPKDDIALSFHRVVGRITHQYRDLTLGSVLYVGYERGALGQQLTAETVRVGPSVFVEQEINPDTRLRLGADMEGKLASLDQPPIVVVPRPMCDEIPRPPDCYLPDVGPMAFELGPEEFIRRAPLRDRPSRSAFGIYAELDLLRTRHVSIESGVRSDLWLIAGESEQAVDPRLTVRLKPFEQLELHAGAGTAHQSAASPLPVPGIADIELDVGLQRAIQSEAGASLEIAGMQLEATGFYHHFSDMVFLELVLDCAGNTDPTINDPRATEFESICEDGGLPRGKGAAYGLELLARTQLGSRLSGLLTYTLGYANANAADGTPFTPQFDVRHLMNLVLGYDWGGGFSTGTRVHFRSGKSAVNTFYDQIQGRYERHELRLPSFFRADLHVSYRFETALAPMTATIGVQNITFSREATKRDCFIGGGFQIECEVDYQPAIVLPNVGLRVEL